MFINNTGVISSILSAGTTNLTGSIVLTLFMILMFLIIIAIMFKIPLEFLVVLILPFCLIVASETSSFWIPITTILIYISTLLAKNWLFK